MRQHWNEVKNQAPTRGLSWDISFKDFWIIAVKNCHYCGAPPNKKRTWPNGASSVCNGLDRIDSDFGYSLDNVVPCCKWCNISKLDRSQGDFLAWIDSVYEFQHSLRTAEALE